jgi:hypothetical protein
MGWGFIEDALEDIEDITKAAFENPLETALAVGATILSGGSTGAAIFAATATAYGNVQMERAAAEAAAALAKFQQEAQGRDLMVREPVGNRKLIYGEVKAAGNIVFMDVTDDNKYLHVVMAVASHECEQLARFNDLDVSKVVYLNDEAVTLSTSGNDSSGVARYVSTGGTYYDSKDSKGSVVRFKFYDGTQTAADADLVAESNRWTSNHILNGIAYVYARFEYHADSFPTGIPNISMLVRGKKLYDPDTDTTSYSTNPALAVRDFLSSEFGFNSTASDFDAASFTTAKNVCNETVTTLSGTETRYTINGVIDTGAKKSEVITNMLTCMMGDLIRTNGKWYVNAGEHRAASITIDEDDCRGAIEVLTKTSRRDRFNSVRGTFLAPDNNYKLSDYPEITSSAYVAEDGETISTQLDLAFTNTASEAQRLAKIHLLASRQEIVVRYPAKLTAFRLQAGDTVAITDDDFGWSGKLFRVQSWTIVYDASNGGSPALGIDLILRETASNIYDWDAAIDETAFDAAPNTNLPSPFEVGDVGLTVTDELRIINNVATTVMIATVTGGGDFADKYQVEAKKSTETEYTVIGRARGNIFERVNVEDGVTYNVRAFAINALGVRSENFTLFNHQIVGKTARPADVTDFHINIVGAEAHLDWSPVGDLDLSHYQIRHTKDLSLANFQDAVDLVPRIAAPTTSVTVPARTGTYFIRAVDTSGNRSANATSVVNAISELQQLNVVQTSTQNPAFSGTKTNTSIDTVTYANNVLRLGSELQFDSRTGNFDDATGNFDDFIATEVTSGSYEFDSYVDLAAKYTSRLTADLKVLRLDFVNFFDDAPGNFDARLGDFDGDPSAFDDINVQLFVSTTNDDPSGSPSWSDYKEFVVGDYTARAYRFKAELSSNDVTSSPAVEELSVTIDMPDSVRADEDIASGTSAKVVTFSPAFQSLQGVAIAAQDMATGDYYAISSKSRTGFTVNFYNALGVNVDRTFDYVAKGYGEVRT